jgi:F420-dependent oxidoreductase-like protein
MKLGVHIVSFDFPGGSAAIGPTLARVGAAAERAGVANLSVMDHYLQIMGDAAGPMLEGYTTLGFLAAHTRTLELQLLVGGVTYRHPGLLAKIVSTLDVLSGGRAVLGVGAAWFERENLALGVPFPPVAERFERLEETLHIVRQMWSDNDGSYAGRHYRLAETLNSPQPLARPHPPIMIGGGGERKTLRLVARYGDASNVFGGPEAIHRKWQILRQHCDEVGRPYDEIERSTLQGVRVSRDGVGGGETPDQSVERFGELGDAGAQHVLFSVRDVWQTDKLELLGSTLLPQLRDA